MNVSAEKPQLECLLETDFKVLAFFMDYYREKKSSPTIRQVSKYMVKNFGYFSSTSAVSYAFDRLCRCGFLKKEEHLHKGTVLPFNIRKELE